MSRPVQPSTLRQLAEWWATLDPRCDAEAHNRIREGETCPRCHRSTATYRAQIERLEWPA